MRKLFKTVLAALGLSTIMKRFKGDREEEHGDKLEALEIDDPRVNLEIDVVLPTSKYDIN